MNDAGRIGFVTRGEYNNTETYDFLDVVYYGNSSYVAKKLTVGNTPADNNEYWQALAKVPVSAVLGVKGNAESAYRTGNVNLTPENIGAAKQSIYGNTTVSFGRKPGSVIGEGSYAFGDNVVASGAFSHAEGGDNDGEVIASGNRSHAEGGSTEATGVESHAEGRYAKASGEISHAEGTSTRATSYASHAEGDNTTASAHASHAEGLSTTASGSYSHTEGRDTSASNDCSHAEGLSTTASARASHAEGCATTASSEFCHAEGCGTTASARASHAEGASTTASGNYSHAEGEYTMAKGHHSHSEGAFTNAENFASHACGKYNKSMSTGGSVENHVGDAFVIGNGTGNGPYEINRSNALRVTYLGDVMGTRAFQSSGADYAEFIKPWADGKPDHEDRVGYYVTLKDGLLEKANEGDYIVGITSGNPSIVGNADEDYYWRYERDEFNRIVLEDVPETIQKTDEEGKLVFDEETHQPVMIETGKIIPKARMKLSKDYDPALQQNYIERKDRKEWDYVGMLGVLPVRDDGSCQPGQFCKCGKDGIATLVKARGFDTYMVLERISENIVSVILK